MKLRTGTARVSGSVVLPYVERGDPGGAPVVLLHAYADSWRSWERVLPRLPPWIHALAPTQRGHGDAAKPRRGYRVEDFVADLEALMDEVGLQRATLAASSSAGFTARMLASRRPERVRALILLGVPWNLGEMRSLQPSFIEAISELRDPVDADFVRDFQQGTSSARVPHDFLESMITESLKVPAHVWRETLAGLLTAPPAVPESDAPALLVWGDRDELAPRSEQDRLLSALGNARLLVYEGVGHAVHWEEPERVARDIAAFVGEVSEQRRAPG